MSSPFTDDRGNFRGAGRARLQQRPGHMAGGCRRGAALLGSRLAAWHRPDRRRGATSRAGGARPRAGASRSGRRRTGSSSSRRSPGCVTSATAASLGVVPTLLVPPQAGHDSCIVDYSAEQSQVKTALRRRAHAALLARLGRSHAADQGRGDRGLPRVHGPRDRADRRAGEPDRRLPGRLAGRRSTPRCARSRCTRSRSPARRSTSTPATR